MHYFALTAVRTCKLLVQEAEVACDTCAFHKTPEELALSRSKAFTRIVQLPAEVQRRISSAYYGGRMPWK